MKPLDPKTLSTICGGLTQAQLDTWLLKSWVRTPNGLVPKDPWFGPNGRWHR